MIDDCSRQKRNLRYLSFRCERKTKKSRSRNRESEQGQELAPNITRPHAAKRENNKGWGKKAEIARIQKVVFSCRLATFPALKGQKMAIEMDAGPKSWLLTVSHFPRRENIAPRTLKL